MSVRRSAPSTPPCPTASRAPARSSAGRSRSPRRSSSRTADDFDAQEWERGKAILRLRVDRVAMQDATAQMALFQFMMSGRKRVAVPSTVHCDHLIRARDAARPTTCSARISENEEVYDFLRSARAQVRHRLLAARAPGIIHQVVLENYAFPGGLMIGTDSHTPNAGGLGMLAIGVGGADCGEVMAGLPWEVLHPKLIGVHLTGKLLGLDGAQGRHHLALHAPHREGRHQQDHRVLRPRRASRSAPPARARSATWAPSSAPPPRIFPFDARMAALPARHRARRRSPTLAEEHREHLVRRPRGRRRSREVLRRGRRDRPRHARAARRRPALARPRRGRSRKLAAEVRENGWPATHHQRADRLAARTPRTRTCGAPPHVAMQALKAGLKAKATFLVTPGSERVFQTDQARRADRRRSSEIGGTVLANACGPCIGQWKRDDIAPSQPNTIVTSFNRNFPGRNDGSPRRCRSSPAPRS